MKKFSRFSAQNWQLVSGRTQCKRLRVIVRSGIPEQKSLMSKMTVTRMKTKNRLQKLKKLRLSKRGVMRKILAVVRRVQQLPAAQSSKMLSQMFHPPVQKDLSPVQRHILLNPRAGGRVVFCRLQRQFGTKEKVQIRVGQVREILTKGHGMVRVKVHKIMVEKDTPAVTRGIRQRKTLILSIRTDPYIGITQNHRC